MIRLMIKSGVLLVLMLSVSVAIAEQKLGYVNPNILMEKSPQGQKAANTIKEEFSDRETKLLASKGELDEMQKSLSRDGDIMSESKRKSMRLDILARQRDIMRDDEAFRQDLAIRRNDLFSGLQEIIRQAIESVGAKSKFDIIFYDGISYGNPKLDVTDQVLSELKRLDSTTGKK